MPAPAKQAGPMPDASIVSILFTRRSRQKGGGTPRPWRRGARGSIWWFRKPSTLSMPPGRTSPSLSMRCSRSCKGFSSNHREMLFVNTLLRRLNSTTCTGVLASVFSTNSGARAAAPFRAYLRRREGDKRRRGFTKRARGYKMGHHDKYGGSYGSSIRLHERHRPRRRGPGLRLPAPARRGPLLRRALGLRQVRRHSRRGAGTWPTPWPCCCATGACRAARR